MRGMKRAIAVSALLLGGVTGWAAGAKAALPCAEWVSTGAGNAPGVGHLRGSSTVTQYWQYELAGITYHVEEQFEVGVYEFDGEMIRIDCRDYTVFR